MPENRHRRRYVLDLSDPRFDFVLENMATTLPEGFRVADGLLELVLRGAGVEPEDAAAIVARRVAFNEARLEASALLGDVGRRLAAAAKEKVGVLAAELQTTWNDAEIERREAQERAVAEAMERIRAEQR